MIKKSGPYGYGLWVDTDVKDMQRIVDYGAFMGARATRARQISFLMVLVTNDKPSDVDESGIKLLKQYPETQ
jgi:hypothetical protein